jgi:hypothetical protein
MKQQGKVWRTIAFLACGLAGGLLTGIATAAESPEAGAAGAANNEVGKIVLVVGEAKITGKEIKVGDSVPVGAELTTGADGYIYLKTIDSGFLILRPGSVAVVEAYQVDLANPKQSRFKFSLRQGVARSISGDAVSKARENFRFNTPVAAIGVRGTDFSIFTNAEETRVAVVSGGVVVSGFDANCLPQGSGPCEGAGSLELFAGTLGILQVQKGQANPSIIRDNKLSPEIVVPPRRDEPKATSAVDSKTDIKVASEHAPESHVTPESDIKAAAPDHQDVTLENDIKAAPPVADSQGVPLEDDIKTTHVVEHPDVPLDPMKQTQLQPIIWGRWQKISEDLPATVDISHLTPPSITPPNPGVSDPDTSDSGVSDVDTSDPDTSNPDLSDLDKTIYGIITIPNSSYVLLWNKNDANTLQMPATGGVGFSLQGSQAHMTGPQGQIAEASVGNGKLNINFDQSTFATQIYLIAAGQAHSLNANGQVTADGIFYNNQNAQGNMIVRGALFQAQQVKGLQGMSASYVFQSDLGNGREASGITVWDKPTAVVP